MSQDLLVDLLAPPCGAILFLFLGWTSSRAIAGGQPLSSHTKRVLGHGALFILGALYAISLGSALRWPLSAPVIIASAWATALLLVALWHRRLPQASRKISNPVVRRAHLRQGFAVVALLISLVMATIEWDFVGKHQGHLLGALLWSAGVVGSILLAQGNRRATVIVTMRAYLVLVVIGAMAGEKAAGLIFAAFAVAIYVAVEKLWKKPQPPVLELEALSRDPEARGNGSHVETKRH
jgi:hypothetical protein